MSTFTMDFRPISAQYALLFFISAAAKELQWFFFAMMMAPSTSFIFELSKNGLNRREKKERGKKKMFLEVLYSLCDRRQQKGGRGRERRTRVQPGITVFEKLPYAVQKNTFVMYWLRLTFLPSLFMLLQFVSLFTTWFTGGHLVKSSGSAGACTLWV